MSETPMQKQYREIKEQYSDALLLFRLGDFYELFYEDAKIASKELGLALTKRVDMPMCGIPWHAYEMYLTKLINNGHKVAICDQLETSEEAKKRTTSGKITVKRGVTRVVTKGTLIESCMMQEKKCNFLLSISVSKRCICIAYADISTNVFRCETVSANDLGACLLRINPEEIICSDDIFTDMNIMSILKEYKNIIHTVPSMKFTTVFSKKVVNDFYGTKFLDAFCCNEEELISAVAMIVEYVSSMYFDAKVKLPFPTKLNQNTFLHMDEFTRKSLEINKSMTRGWSLLNTIDKTLTASGARMLADWVASPLIDLAKIEKRLFFVEFFTKKQELLNKIRKILQKIPDIERALTRIYMKKGGPRDLIVVKDAITGIFALHNIVLNHQELKDINIDISQVKPIYEKIDAAIVCENIPYLARDGGFIKFGYDCDLDEFRKFAENGNTFVSGLQSRYIADTGINTLKIKQNGVLGYFIEITPNNSSKIPYSFIHRQTLSSCIRYTTPELENIATKIYTSNENARKRELIIFEQICAEISFFYDALMTASQKISYIDCLSAFAFLAIENKYSKPTIVKEKILHIKNGWHPVVERSLAKDGEIFVKNSCYIDDNSIISLITGPNMGGKSTYLRQNALIVIMAQIGSFVPAEEATIGIADKLFSRVGANDDIAAGKSTFMVEMLETATILHQATPKSLVIIDEIGRGTSTYDGLAIAWAVINELHNKIQARTLFSTHYHELKNINLKNIKFLTALVDERDDKVTFLHKITDGFADKSYGIQVAKIAGFPTHVIDDASKILGKLANPMTKN